MQYMLLIHADETAMPKVSTADSYDMNSAYVAYTAALQKAGALVAGDRLKPSTLARVVRMKGERAEVLDGPFADIKEQLGGYYLINAGTFDEALAWAKQCPGARIGSVEVRPVWDAAMRA